MKWVMLSISMFLCSGINAMKELSLVALLEQSLLEADQTIPIIQEGDFQQVSHMCGSLPFSDGSDDDKKVHQVYDAIQKEEPLQKFLKDPANFKDEEIQVLLDCILEDDGERMRPEHRLLDSMLDGDKQMHVTAKYLYITGFHLIAQHGWEHYVRIRQANITAILKPLEFIARLAEKRKASKR